jgi:hypothetical protein
MSTVFTSELKGHSPWLGKRSLKKDVELVAAAHAVLRRSSTRSNGEPLNLACIA